MTLRKIVLGAFALSSLSAFASFPEFFGSGITTASIGNQANRDKNDAANLYYLPALNAFADRVALNAGASMVATEFDPINNVVQTNSTNGETGETTTSGSVNVDYDPRTVGNVHIILPIRYKDSGTIGLSYFSTLGKFAETDSGDPKLPEYVMYRSRYARTQLMLSYAFPWSENLAFSLGAHVGFQASAKVNTKVSLGNDYGSSAGARTEIAPSLGAVLSAAYRTSEEQYGFSFQQEMKHNLETIATGDITDPPLTLINIGIESMIYYDPHIFRFSHARSIGSFDFFASLEYQLWENYKPPTIRVINRGGSVKASDDYEQLKLRNIFVPKIGMSLLATPSLKINAGLHYRQTPIESNFSDSGNSVDANSMVASGGLTYSFKMFKKDMEIGGVLQYHKLEEVKVTKSSGQENGSSGKKIGDPGYTVGGSVIMSQLGIKVLL